MVITDTQWIGDESVMKRTTATVLLLLLLLIPVSIASTQPVYHPQRLQVIKSNVTLTGTVLSMPERQQDGDSTFEVQANGQTYHAEIVCVFPPELQAASQACRGYTNRIPIPRRGDKVRITGTLVRDLNHYEEFHELEIHPVTSLVILNG